MFNEQYDSESLTQLAYQAEDEEKDVRIFRSGHTSVIEYIEIDGVQIENDFLRDELDDLYWAEKTEASAERSWRE